MNENGTNQFGEMVKNKRLEMGKTLRSFCIEHGYDPGNHSKIERGILKPSLSEDWLLKLGTSLGFREQSEEMEMFFDLAYIANQKLPEYIMSDKELLNKLPAFFRTIGNHRHSKEKIEILINQIKTE